MNRSLLLTATALMATGTAMGQQTPPAPLSQAIESVSGNLANDPENPGLNRARQQLLENQQRIQTGQPESANAAEGLARSNRSDADNRGTAASQGRGNGGPGGQGGGMGGNGGSGGRGR
jgi:hypothetical protein